MEERTKALKMCHTHWEKDVSKSVFPRPNKKKPQEDFLAKEPEDWPQPHVKVNEEDY